MIEWALKTPKWLHPPAGSKWVARALRRCEDTRLKEYNRCKKTGFKDGTILSADDVAACIADDPQGRVRRACTDKVISRVENQCVEKGVPLTAAFPSIGVGDGAALVGVLDERGQCLTCLALNAADALQRDCDEVDNGQADSSCPGGLATPPLL